METRVSSPLTIPIKKFSDNCERFSNQEDSKQAIVNLKKLDELVRLWAKGLGPDVEAAKETEICLVKIQCALGIKFSAPYQESDDKQKTEILKDLKKVFDYLKSKRHLWFADIPTLISVHRACKIYGSSKNPLATSEDRKFFSEIEPPSSDGNEAWDEYFLYQTWADSFDMIFNRTVINRVETWAEAKTHIQLWHDYLKKFSLEGKKSTHNTYCQFQLDAMILFVEFEDNFERHQGKSKQYKKSQAVRDKYNQSFRDALSQSEKLVTLLETLTKAESNAYMMLYERITSATRTAQVILVILAQLSKLFKNELYGTNKTKFEKEATQSKEILIKLVKTQQSLGLKLFKFTNEQSLKLRLAGFSDHKDTTGFLSQFGLPADEKETPQPPPPVAATPAPVHYPLKQLIAAAKGQTAGLYGDAENTFLYLESEEKPLPEEVSFTQDLMQLTWEDHYHHGRRLHSDKNWEKAALHYRIVINSNEELKLEVLSEIQKEILASAYNNLAALINNGRAQAIDSENAYDLLVSATEVLPTHKEASESLAECHAPSIQQKNTLLEDEPVALAPTHELPIDTTLRANLFENTFYYSGPITFQAARHTFLQARELMSLEELNLWHKHLMQVAHCDPTVTKPELLFFSTEIVDFIANRERASRDSSHYTSHSQSPAGPSPHPTGYFRPIHPANTVPVRSGMTSRNRLFDHTGPSSPTTELTEGPMSHTPTPFE